MTLARVGGAAATIGGLAWLVLFWNGNRGTPIAWLEETMWALPLAFGLGVMGLYAAGTSAFDRVAIVLAAIVSVVAAAALVGGDALALEPAAAYASWLVFVGGIGTLLILVLAYGVRHRWRSLVGLVALVGAALPVAFLAIIFAYKLLTGWWVTDPALISIGTGGAAILIGGAWVALGLALLLRPPVPEVPEQESSVA